MLMLSGPVELFVFDCLMALAVCVMSMIILVDGSFCVYLSIFLLFLCVLCCMLFVNCLLNRVAFCLFVMAMVLLKVIVVLGLGRGFLFVRFASVFQSLCVLCLWSQSSSRCCFQRSVLCFCICVSISVFRFGSVGSVGFCLLMLFLFVIRFLMFCGSNLCWLCCFPLGM